MIIYGSKTPHTTINAPGGNDIIIAPGAYTTINGGPGDIVSAPGGYDTFNQGTSNNYAPVNAGTSDLLAFGGSGNIVNGDDANYSITDFGGGQNQVTLGNGDNTVLLGGSNNTVSAGYGADNLVFLGGGNSALFDRSNYYGTGDYYESVTFTGQKNVFNENIVDPSAFAGDYTDGSANVSGGDGYGSFTFTHGNFVLNTGGQYNTVNVGDGTADITPGSGHDSVTIDPPFYSLGVNGGIDAVHLAGKYNSVTAFAQNLTVDGGDGSSTYNFAYDLDLESENFNQMNSPVSYTVTAGGSYNKFTLLDSDANTITTGNGGANVSIGNAYALNDMGQPTGPVTNYGITNITFGGLNNVLTDTGGGNVNVTGGTGQGIFTFGSGEDSLTTGGYYNVVKITGNPEDIIDPGSGHDTVTVNDGGAIATLHGVGDRITFNSSGGVVTDDAQGLLINVGLDLGSVSGPIELKNLASDPHFLVDLLNGLGGYTTAAQAAAAIYSDGAGGSILPLIGATIHFDNIAHVSASSFKIG